MSARARSISKAAGLALLANAALTWLLARADEGLITPESTLSPAMLLLGAVTLGVRLTVVLLLPPFLAYAATNTLLRLDLRSRWRR
jgi:hypothetical protein